MEKLNKIVLASGNQGKLKELRDMLAPLGLEILSQADFNITPAEETAPHSEVLQEFTPLAMQVNMETMQQITRSY